MRTMKTWTPAEVVALDDRESQFAAGRLRFETPEYLLFVVPGSHELTYVRRFQSTPEQVEATIDEVLARARSAGAPGIRWAISPSSTPEDLSKRLGRRGFVQFAAAETLYFPLGTTDAPRIPPGGPPGSISIREAITDEEMDVFSRLGEEIFGDPPAPAEFLRNLRAEVRETIRTTGHSELFLAYARAMPVGRGGLSVTGPVGRLWTSGVLVSHRRLGAYSALVRERCRVALAMGAELALTHALVGSSGPILKRLGFESAGSYAYYEKRFV
jgi:hypothetical protein